MLLPRYKNRNRLIVMVCQECHHEYLGHPISKYCPKHREIKNRKPKKKIKQKEMNRIVKTNAFDVIERAFKCGLRGCKNIFLIKIYPRQTLYPKFCPEHRTEYRRKYFLEQRKQNGKKRKRRRKHGKSHRH